MDSEAGQEQQKLKNRIDKLEQLREDVLLAEVQPHGQLYDLSRTDYKDIGKRKETWQAIAMTLGRSAVDAQHRFEYLRREYGRIKNASKTKSGQSAAQKKMENQSSVWRRMEWLSPFISTRSKTSNMDTKGEDHKQDEDPIAEEDTHGHEDTSQSSIQLVDQPTQSAGKRRKIDNTSTSIEALLTAASSAIEAASASEKDECGLFAKSISEGLRTLSVSRRRYAMFKMQEMLYTMTEQEIHQPAAPVEAVPGPILTALNQVFPPFDENIYTSSVPQQW